MINVKIIMNMYKGKPAEKPGRKARSLKLKCYDSPAAIDVMLAAFLYAKNETRLKTEFILGGFLC